MPKKEKIQNMFDSIAPEYDKLNHIMSLDIDKSWRRRAVKYIFKPDTTERAMASSGDSETGGLHILDIACGTGDFSIAIAREMMRRAHACSEETYVQPGEEKPQGGEEDSEFSLHKAHTGGYWPGHVTGLDLSEGMPGVMAEKVREAGLEDIVSYELGDSENLRFEDGSFDRVTVAFGVRNFEDREKGLREMLRVLRPGGELVILELSVPSNAVLRWLFNLYFLHILPLIGGKVSGDKAAYRYLPASVLGFPGKRRFMHTLRECGFRNVRHKAFTFGICRMYSGEKPFRAGE